MLGVRTGNGVVRGSRGFLEIGVLGPVQVRTESHSGLERPAQRRLLSILVHDLGRAITTEVIIDRFWPETTPVNAKASIQTHVSALRKKLGREFIGTEGHGYRLDVADDQVDAHRFVMLADQARAAFSRGEHQESLDLTGKAVSLWRGNPYLELTYDTWARPEITRLEEARLNLLELRAEALLATGREAELIPDLEGLVTEHPLRERLWGHLMLARHRVGRHAEGLDTYRRLSEHLAKIGLEPGEELKQLEERILLHDSSLSPTRNNLPSELDSFVGRETEIRETKKLLADHRLVTLTGPGGSGKTRLAIRIARDLVESFPDGVRFVDLVPLHDPEVVASHVARSVGLRPEGDPVESLTQALATQQTLMILDNCEHLGIGPAQLIATLLRSTSGLKILATSRARLRVPGENVYSVPGMSTQFDSPDGDGDALRLFAERAGQVFPGFSLAGQASDVAAICRRLDGLPLAIELAAVQTSAFDVESLTRLLDNRFQILVSGASTGPERHENLAATIGWSFDLLNDLERAVFSRLAVFRDGFTLDAATQVCSDEELVPPDLFPAIVSRLVESSLVDHYRPDAGDRYRQLETVREFAAVRLDQIGETGRWRRRHAEYFASMRENVTIDMLIGADAGNLLRRFFLEEGNFRQALEWSIGAGEHRVALDTLVGFRIASRSAGNMESLRWAEQVADTAGDDLSDENRAALLYNLGELHGFTGRLDRGIELLTKSVDTYRALDDAGVGPSRTAEFTDAINSLCQLILWNGAAGERNEVYIEYQREMLDLARRRNEQAMVAIALGNLAHTGDPDRDPEEARRLFAEAEELASRIGAERPSYILAWQRAGFEFHQGNFLEAREYAAESQRLSESAQLDSRDRDARVFRLICGVAIGELDSMDDYRATISETLSSNGSPLHLHQELLVLVVGIEANRGNYERAAWGIGASRVIEESGHVLRWDLVPYVEELRNTVRHELGEERYAELEAEGSATTAEEIATYLLSL